MSDVAETSSRTTTVATLAIDVAGERVIIRHPSTFEASEIEQWRAAVDLVVVGRSVQRLQWPNPEQEYAQPESCAGIWGSVLIDCPGLEGFGTAMALSHGNAFEALRLAAGGATKPGWPMPDQSRARTVAAWFSSRAAVSKLAELLARAECNDG